MGIIFHNQPISDEVKLATLMPKCFRGKNGSADGFFEETKMRGYTKKITLRGILQKQGDLLRFGSWDDNS